MTRCTLVGACYLFRKNLQDTECRQQVPPKLNIYLYLRFRFQSSGLERKVSWGFTQSYFTMKMDAVYFAENLANMSQT